MAARLSHFTYSGRQRIMKPSIAVLGLITVGIAVWACGHLPQPEQASPTVQKITVQVTDTHDVVPTTSALPVEDAESMFVTGDKTLVIVTKTTLRARADDGRVFSYTLADEDRNDQDARHEGVRIEHKDGTCSVLRTPSLEVVVAHAKCTIPMSITGMSAGFATTVMLPGGIAPRHVVVYQKHGKVFQVPLDKNHIEAPYSIDVSESGSSLVTTFQVDGGSMPSVGYLLNAATGSVIRSVPPSGEQNGQSAGTLVHEESYYAAVGDTLQEIDMMSGALKRSISMGCKKASRVKPQVGDIDYETFVHSPKVAGSFITIGCGPDLLIFENGRRTGRIPRVLPGCDNGFILVGSLNANSGIQSSEGCMGLAKIDIKKRAFVCADNEGIAGAAYALAPGGPGEKAPLGRGKLPRCGKGPEEGAHYLDEATEVYWMIEEEQKATVVHSAASSFTLEPGANQALSYETSPSEAPTSLAYVLGREVIVRSLPGGAIKTRWRF
jgi:hypothetical protein